MAQYNPLLREFFQSKGHRIDIDRDEIGNTQIQGVYEAFLDLDDADRRDLEIELHDIHTVAQSDDGVRMVRAICCPWATPEVNRRQEFRSFVSSTISSQAD